MPRPHDLPVFLTSDMEVEIIYAVSLDAYESELTLLSAAPSY
jgi:hypothetical protein